MNFEKIFKSFIKIRSQQDVGVNDAIIVVQIIHSVFRPLPLGDAKVLPTTALLPWISSFKIINLYCEFHQFVMNARQFQCYNLRSYSHFYIRAHEICSQNFPLSVFESVANTLVDSRMTKYNDDKNTHIAESERTIYSQVRMVVLSLILFNTVNRSNDCHPGSSDSINYTDGLLLHRNHVLVYYNKIR